MTPRVQTLATSGTNAVLLCTTERPHFCPNSGCCDVDPMCSTCEGGG